MCFLLTYLFTCCGCFNAYKGGSTLEVRRQFLTSKADPRTVIKIIVVDQ